MVIYLYRRYRQYIRLLEYADCVSGISSVDEQFPSSILSGKKQHSSRLENLFSPLMTYKIHFLADGNGPLEN